MTGTNTKTTDTGLTNAAAIINQNKEFIVQDCFAYINNVFPAFTGDLVRIRNDIQSFIRAMIRDLEYPGNYGTLIVRPQICKSSSRILQLLTCFIAETPGLRNCTIEGLSGTLNPPVFMTFISVPTGGACVSLDPGWGSDDDPCGL